MYMPESTHIPSLYHSDVSWMSLCDVETVYNRPAIMSELTFVMETQQHTQNQPFIWIICHLDSVSKHFPQKTINIWNKFAQKAAEVTFFLYTHQHEIRQ